MFIKNTLPRRKRTRPRLFVISSRRTRFLQKSASALQLSELSKRKLQRRLRIAVPGQERERIPEAKNVFDRGSERCELPENKKQYSGKHGLVQVAGAAGRPLSCLES
jgi:hypothetical protein